MANRLSQQTSYRAAWIAVQEEGNEVMLRGIAFPKITEAEAERDACVRLPHVVRAWVEVSRWEAVFDSSVPGPACCV